MIGLKNDRGLLMPKVVSVSIPMSEIKEGTMNARTVDGREIVVCRTKDGIYALDNICTHAYARLNEGRLRGNRLICPLHGASFDVRDGRALGPPAMQALPTHPLQVSGDQVDITVEIPDERPLSWG
jgi:3-phenylpropionate/trans-cinnamate dioxygenase ferredoxin subunit